MYTFELYYFDIHTGRDIIKTLKIDSQLYKTEKENEMLYGIEFITCF